MLKSIKDIITQKKVFQEAADLLLENEQLDDEIILLSEGPDEPELPEKPEENQPEETPAEENPSEEPVNDDTTNLDDESLPEPVGRQTGEPINIDNTDDILNIEIDLTSNTQADILPTPPANASDAVADEEDILNTKIDSGFGGDSGVINHDNSDDILDMEIDKAEEDKAEVTEEPDEDILNTNINEAISVGGENPEENSSEEAPDTATEEPTPDTTNTEEPAEENPVTAAVKDKVSEMETDSAVSMGDPNDIKDKLLQKLGSITKSLEDTKKEVINSIR